MALTRDEILGKDDLAAKEITIPDTIEKWAGETVHIRQLSRGEQDIYLKRQYGGARMKQNQNSKDQEISAFSIYGHDSWLFAHGVCDEDGKRIFKNSDVDDIAGKSGEFVGHVAKEILIFSNMVEDAEAAEDLGESEIKN